MQSPGCSPSPRWGRQQPALRPGVFRAPLPWSQPPTGRATSWGAAREWVRLWPPQSGHRNLPFLAPHSPEALGAAQGPGNGAGVLGAAPQSPQTNLGSQGGSEHQSWVAAGSLLCEQGSNLPSAPPARHGGFPAQLQPPRLHAPVALLALSSRRGHEDTRAAPPATRRLLLPSPTRALGEFLEVPRGQGEIPSHI